MSPFSHVPFFPVPFFPRERGDKFYVTGIPRAQTEADYAGAGRGNPEGSGQAAGWGGTKMPVAGIPLEGNELPGVGDSSNVSTGGTAGRETIDEKSAKAVAEALNGTA